MDNSVKQKNKKRNVVVSEDPCKYIEEIEFNALDEKTHKVNIDFDSFSKEWRRNKVKGDNGSFTYRCRYVHSTGKICGRASCKIARHKEPKIYNLNLSV